MNAYELAKQMLDVTDCETSEYYQAGIMLKHQADYIAQLEKGLESSIAMNKAQAERQVKELTDEEITDVFVECLLPDGEFDEHEFARAILRKAQEK